MSRVLACLPLDEFACGTSYLSQHFDHAKITLNHTEFQTDLPEDTAQIAMFIEEDFSQNDNIFRMIAYRDVQYLFFSKAANPLWKENSGPGRIIDETGQFILWQVEG